MTTEERGQHRIVLQFDDGSWITRLICPKGGCEPATTCASCGRDTRDSESKGCYDCKDGFGDECWVKGWVDNLTPEELLKGTIEVPVDAEFDGEGAILHICDEPVSR